MEGGEGGAERLDDGVAEAEAVGGEERLEEANDIKEQKKLQKYKMN